MAATRTKALGVGVVVLLVAAAIAAFTVGSSGNSTSTANLAGSGAVPAGVTPQTFAPPDIGATLMVPSSWVNVPPSSGFQHVIRGLTPPAGFVGASRRGGVLRVTVSQLESQRKEFLQGARATIESATTGTVDNRPAVRLHYKISGNGFTVSDTEYDIIATSTLAAGAAQHQTAYDVIVLVLGTPVSQPNPALVDWISSTIRIRS